MAWAAVHLPAQTPYGAKPYKGPRALGLIELPAKGKPHFIPIAILVNGTFYDASAYKADPVPMALWSETVYEGLRTGVSQGLFTVTNAVVVEATPADAENRARLLNATTKADQSRVTSNQVQNYRVTGAAVVGEKKTVNVDAVSMPTR